MRASLHFCVVLTAIVWLAICFAPVGLNICVQDSGRTEIGLGCACDKCDAEIEYQADDCVGNCCDRDYEQDSFGTKCCTCTRLVLLAGTLQPKPESPQIASAPAVLLQLADPFSLSPAEYSAVRCAQVNPPPLLSRTTVLQI